MSLINSNLHILQVVWNMFLTTTFVYLLIKCGGIFNQIYIYYCKFCQWQKCILIHISLLWYRQRVHNWKYLFRLLGRCLWKGGETTYRKMCVYVPTGRFFVYQKEDTIYIVSVINLVDQGHSIKRREDGNFIECKLPTRKGSNGFIQKTWWTRLLKGYGWLE